MKVDTKYRAISRKIKRYDMKQKEFDQKIILNKNKFIDKSLPLEHILPELPSLMPSVEKKS